MTIVWREYRVSQRSMREFSKRTVQKLYLIPEMNVEKLGFCHSGKGFGGFQSVKIFQSSKHLT